MKGQKKENVRSLLKNHGCLFSINFLSKCLPRSSVFYPLNQPLSITFQGATQLCSKTRCSLEYHEQNGKKSIWPYRHPSVTTTTPSFCGFRQPTLGEWKKGTEERCCQRALVFKRAARCRNKLLCYFDRNVNPWDFTFWGRITLNKGIKWQIGDSDGSLLEIERKSAQT